ncbi:MAG TPA: ATP-binding protein [Candidatus Limnocylindria bacterium]|nr:ATP-binding protein [Candidatus Limnocylindria bacterium]
MAIRGSRVVPGVRAAIGVALLLAGTSVLVGILERWVGVPDASSTYLLAVLASAAYLGVWPAIATAIGGFLLYNFLFVHPNLTFTVSDPGELLNLILLLVLGIAVGQLAAAQRSRAQAAIEREHEATALFRISRALATRPDTAAVLDDLAGTVRTDANLDRVLVALARPSGGERVVTDTGGLGTVPDPSIDHVVLRRMPGDTPARWIRVHPPAGPRPTEHDHRAYRVMIEAGGESLGSIWAIRARRDGEPGQSATRLLAAAADQIGQAYEQDRLAAEARTAEIARRSDAAKTALLESVSHDLRTPLATIRAAAGTILEGPETVPEADRRASAEAIDREADHLNRMVTNLLDLGRIEGGSLRADREVLAFDEAVTSALDRYRSSLVGRQVAYDWPDDLPPVYADPVFLGQVLANLLDNAAAFVPQGGRIRITAAPVDGVVRFRVEDSGPGVPADALPHLFEKFYRAGTPGVGTRRGTGTGLAVVHGLVDAMGGQVRARPSELGGLAVEVDLPAAPQPPGSEAGR